MPASVVQSQSAFRAALCDSFNTALAIETLLKLVSRANAHINTAGRELNLGVVENAARWVGRMLRMFGLGEGEKAEMGWGEERRSAVAINVGASGPSDAPTLTTTCPCSRTSW